MTSPVLFFFDTTAFFHNSTMSAPAWDSLASATRSGVARVGVSEVTVLEISRQVREKAEKLQETVASATEVLRSHGVRVTAPTAPSTDSVESDFRSRLAARGVRVLPLPAVAHDVLVARDIETRLPFNRSGKGYRDALIWHSFLEWLADQDGVERAYFVTANTGDFAGKDKQLDTGLVSELPAGVDVELLQGLPDAASRVRELKRLPEPPKEPSEPDDSDEDGESAIRSAEHAALHAFQALEGQEWENIESYPFALDPVESVSVAWVTVDEGSIEAELVDTVSETMIWDVRATARVGVEGMVHRGDAFHLGREWDVSVGDLDDYYIEATRTLNCVLVADVRVEADEVTTDAAITEILVRREDT